MSASEATIEQRIVQAGFECHTLVQAIHDQLKADYVRKQYRLLGSLDRLKTRMGRFCASLSGSQVTSKRIANTVLIASFGGLHVMDGIITYLGLAYAELVEVNPLLNYFTGLMGLGVSIALLKLVILAVIVVIFTRRCAIRGHWGTATLALAVVFYSGVVINNVLLVAGL